jgi:hypothetical protein
MLGIPPAHLPGSLVEPMPSFVALNAALLADPPVTLAHRLPSASRIERLAVVFASLAERCGERVARRLLNLPDGGLFSRPVFSKPVIVVALSGAVPSFVLIGTKPMERTIESFSAADTRSPVTARFREASRRAELTAFDVAWNQLKFFFAMLAFGCRSPTRCRMAAKRRAILLMQMPCSVLLAAMPALLLVPFELGLDPAGLTSLRHWSASRLCPDVTTALTTPCGQPFIFQFKCFAHAAMIDNASNSQAYPLNFRVAGSDATEQMVFPRQPFLRATGIGGGVTRTRALRPDCGPLRSPSVTLRVRLALVA